MKCVVRRFIVRVVAQSNRLNSGGGGEGRLTTQWLAALRVKVFKAVVFKLFMAVVFSGCQCWSQREKGEAGVLLFNVSCPLCCSRPSLGPPDDLSSCSFEGQYTPLGPDTRTNDENTDSSGQPLGVRPTKMATTYVTQSGGLWVPVPLKQARHSGESTRNESRSNAESTNLQNSARRERLRRPRSPG